MNEQAWDRISADYYSEVLSPIKHSKHNPLIDEIKQLDTANLSVIELGCGLGELTPFLEENFKEVDAIDFSPEMIVQAKERHTSGKTNFFVMDMSNMEELYGKYDVAVAVNSILTTDMMKLNKIIGEIHKILKPGGKLFVIIPSMECYIYQNMLYLDAQINRDVPQEKAIIQASKLLDHKSYDTFQGMIDFEGEMQRAFYRFEIKYRFGRIGFVNFNIERVPYIWSRWKEAGQRYFPKEEPPWDWFFSCTKQE